MVRVYIEMALFLLFQDFLLFRDWSLITGRGGGGATKREGGGDVKFYP